jgi:DHA1 family bicyclomycin/chloramphenicol resistance-like MFS transporter
MGYGAFCTAAAGFWPDNPAVSMIATLALSSAIAWLSFKSAPRPLSAK